MSLCCLFLFTSSLLWSICWAVEAVTCASELDFGKLIAVDEQRKLSEAFVSSIPVVVIQPLVNGRHALRFVFSFFAHPITNWHVSWITKKNCSSARLNIDVAIGRVQRLLDARAQLDEELCQRTQGGARDDSSV